MQHRPLMHDFAHIALDHFEHGRPVDGGSDLAAKLIATLVAWMLVMAPIRAWQHAHFLAGW